MNMRRHIRQSAFFIVVLLNVLNGSLDQIVAFGRLPVLNWLQEVLHLLGCPMKDFLGGPMRSAAFRLGSWLAHCCHPDQIASVSFRAKQ